MKAEGHRQEESLSVSTPESLQRLQSDEVRENDPREKSAVSVHRGMEELEIHGTTRQGAGISQVRVGTNGVKETVSQRGTEGGTRME